LFTVKLFRLEEGRKGRENKGSGYKNEGSSEGGFTIQYGQCKAGQCKAVETSGCGDPASGRILTQVTGE
jgi:hypothetical protein